VVVLALLLACSPDKGGDSARSGNTTSTRPPASDSGAGTTPAGTTSSTETGRTPSTETGDSSDSADSGRSTTTSIDTGDTGPDPVEVCGTGEDEDADGRIDCADTDCACTADCFAERIAAAPNLLMSGDFEGEAPVAGGLPDSAGLW
jgi:hypothetical protein